MQSAAGPIGAIRTLVAGYTRIHAELLAEGLKRDRRIQVIGVASSFREVLEVATHSPIDVAVISSNLDEQAERGFEVLRELRALHSHIRVIILLDSAKKESVLKAFRAGAKGIFSKNSPLLGLCKCVRCVHDGQIWISQEELELVLDKLSNTPAVHAVDASGISLLTKRELEVVECVAEGLANHEIAKRLQLSKHTVKNYLFHIFDKLGVSNRVELLFLTLGRSTLRGEPSAAQPNIGWKDAEGFHGDVPEDPVAGYMQCLTAERANVEAGMQIAAAKERLAASMTPEQILSAEQQTSASLKKETGYSHATLPNNGASNSGYTAEPTGSESVFSGRS
jgi:two-component system nitrate/nitrite response regulator NarL